jgi:hypothetical protein
MFTTNLFKVSNFKLGLKDSKHIELNTTAVNIPGLSLGEINVPRPVVRDLRGGEQLTYDDLIISVLCDEKLEAYKEVYDYIMKSANPVNANIDVSYPVFDSSLLLTTNKNNIQHKITFLNCFFKSVGGMQLTSSSTEEDHINFDVTLGYSYYLFE